ncbi:MAG: nucleotide exchange factor GrpE [Solirubrobacterales bacterium]|nr:nucleotide exchange factor GrpE [Solirubrobacterales bacterium]
MIEDPAGNGRPEEEAGDPGAQSVPGPTTEAARSGGEPVGRDAGPGQPEQGDTAVERDLNALVEEARSKADEYLDLAQRTRADFDNYRKRMASENLAAGQRGRFEVIEGVIGAIDNLERVLDAAGIDRTNALENEIPSEAPVTDQGLIVAWRDLHAILGRAEVEVYSPEGEQFDPLWHEALQAVPAEGAGSGTVLEVLQRGYRSGETVLRAARVVVAQ